MWSFLKMEKFYFSLLMAFHLYSEIVIFMIIWQVKRLRVVQFGVYRSRCAVVQFWYHSDYRPNWTPLNPITIANIYYYIFKLFVKQTLFLYLLKRSRTQTKQGKNKMLLWKKQQQKSTGFMPAYAARTYPMPMRQSRNLLHQRMLL